MEVQVFLILFEVGFVNLGFEIVVWIDEYIVVVELLLIEWIEILFSSCGVWLLFEKFVGFLGEVCWFEFWFLLVEQLLL